MTNNQPFQYLSGEKKNTTFSLNNRVEFWALDKGVRKKGGVRKPPIISNIRGEGEYGSTGERSTTTKKVLL